jgi:hypothetical protein
MPRAGDEGETERRGRAREVCGRSLVATRATAHRTRPPSRSRVCRIDVSDVRPDGSARRRAAEICIPGLLPRKWDAQRARPLAGRVSSTSSLAWVGADMRGSLRAGLRRSSVATLRTRPLPSDRGSAQGQGGCPDRLSGRGREVALTAWQTPAAGDYLASARSMQRRAVWLQPPPGKNCLARACWERDTAAASARFLLRP